MTTMEPLNLNRTGGRSMFLRVVLVGMVAAMGVTLPARWGWDHSFSSAGAWTNSMLADWNTWTPRETATRSFRENRRKAECPECRLARERFRLREQFAIKIVRSLGAGATGGSIAVAAASLGASAPPPRAIELAGSVALPLTPALGELSATRTSKETPGVAVRATLESVVAAPSANPLPAAAIRENGVTASTSPRFAGSPRVPENLERTLLARICQQAEHVREGATHLQTADLAAANAESVDGEFLCGDSEMDCDETPAVSALSKASTVISGAQAVGTAPIAPVAEHQPESVFGAEFDLGGCFGSGAPAETTSTSHGIVALPELPRDVFARPTAKPAESMPATPRLAVLPDLPRNVFAPPLNPVSTTLPTAVDQRPASPKLADLPRDVFAPPLRNVVAERAETTNQKLPATSSGFAHQELPGARWGHAMQLTRDAVYAWLSVLTKPGVVEVSRQ
jgi:hypothetical protein